MSNRAPSAPPVLSGFSYIRPLGTGGFADVFLYEQNLPRRQVAVKVLLSSTLTPEQLRMFNAEADVLARLSSHPSIVTIYQASISPDGRPYLVMEYCPSSISQRYRKEVMALSEVLNIGIKISSAVETVHRSGLLHRDIKPSNVLITGFGSPVLSDFGIVSKRTSTEELLAMSVPWSAPEVVNELTSGTVASEVWSLAATFYSLLAGRTPFERPGKGVNTREQLRARISQAKYPYIGRADVPEPLERVLAKAMSAKPHQRYQSAAEFAYELQKVQSGMGLPSTPLEFGDEGWNLGGGQVNFANAQVRGPVRPQVQVESQRKRKAGAAHTMARSDEQIIETGRSGVPKAVWWIIAGSVAAVATAVVLVVTGVL